MKYLEIHVLWAHMKHFERHLSLAMHYLHVSERCHMARDMSYQVSFAKEPYKSDYIHVIWSISKDAYHWQCTMGWLRLVGSLKLYVSFAKEPYKSDYILQKRPMIWRSLRIVATPKLQRHRTTTNDIPHLTCRSLQVTTSEVSRLHSSRVHKTSLTPWDDFLFCRI